MIENIHHRPILISKREGGIFSPKRSQSEHFASGLHPEASVGSAILGTLSSRRGTSPSARRAETSLMPPKDSKRLFLIDAMGYIFRAFYAPMPQRLSNAKGLPT